MNTHSFGVTPVDGRAPGAGFASTAHSFIGYTILDNGSSVCILFPFVPGADRAWIEGSDLHIQIPGGDIVLMEIGQAALDAAARFKLAVVGVDALRRPVYERRVGPESANGGHGTLPQ